MINRGLNGSAIQYISALSPTTFAAAGSTNAFQLQDVKHLTVGVFANSADAVVNVERSATSNGTFAQVGLSIQSQASGLVVRSMPLNSSATWYKASYDNGNAGSVTATIMFVGQGMRNVPINQDSNTTVLSDIA